MKKTPRKLTLSKETLRALENERLSEVLGQASTNPTCGPTQISYCIVCGPKPIENY
jgi:hypothetical protein